VDESPFFGKNALGKAAEDTLNRVHGLKAFLFDGRIEIDNNPAENAIRPNVIGRKNWLFSVSEAGAKANAIGLSLAETAKANGIDLSIPRDVNDRIAKFTDSPAARDFK
jgi:transposase